jgi:GT2 family glycosyltransferase
METWMDACRCCDEGATLHLLDNASEDGSLEWMGREYPHVPIRRMEKNIILQAYNHLLGELDTEYVMILNNDVRLNRHCLTPLIKRLDEQSDAFGVMPKIVEGEGGTLFRKGGKFFRGHLGLVDLDSGPGGTLLLHGAAMVVRRERFLELGGFDPTFFYFEDNDLSYRAWRKGYTCWFEPSSEVEHSPSSTTDHVYQGVVNRRALKEKGSLLFVMKNIYHGSWRLNTLLWTIIKSLRMIVTWDRSRYWALREVMKNTKKVLSYRCRRKGLDDEEILAKVKALIP